MNFIRFPRWTLFLNYFKISTVPYLINRPLFLSFQFCFAKTFPQMLQPWIFHKGGICVYLLICWNCNLTLIEIIVRAEDIQRKNPRKVKKNRALGKDGQNMHKLFKRKNKIFQKETKQANDLNKIVLFIKKIKIEH